MLHYLNFIFIGVLLHGLASTLAEPACSFPNGVTGMAAYLTCINSIPTSPAVQTQTVDMLRSSLRSYAVVDLVMPEAYERREIASMKSVSALAQQNLSDWEFHVSRPSCR